MRLSLSRSTIIGLSLIGPVIAVVLPEPAAIAKASIVLETRQGGDPGVRPSPIPLVIFSLIYVHCNRDVLLVPNAAIAPPDLV